MLSVRYVWLEILTLKLIDLPDDGRLRLATLKRLSERWDERDFVRIRRPHMVFLSLVTELQVGPSGHKVRLGSGPDAVDVSVSRRELKKFKQRWVQKFRINKKYLPRGLKRHLDLL